MGKKNLCKDGASGFRKVFWEEDAAESVDDSGFQ